MRALIGTMFVIAMATSLAAQPDLYLTTSPIADTETASVADQYAPSNNPADIEHCFRLPAKIAQPRNLFVRKSSAAGGGESNNTTPGDGADKQGDNYGGLKLAGGVGIQFFSSLFAQPVRRQGFALEGLLLLTPVVGLVADVSGHVWNSQDLSYQLGFSYAFGVHIQVPFTEFVGGYARFMGNYHSTSFTDLDDTVSGLGMAISVGAEFTVPSNRTFRFFIDMRIELGAINGDTSAFIEAVAGDLQCRTGFRFIFG